MSRSLALFLVLAALPADAAVPLLELPLRIRIARCGGNPVRSEAWVREHVAAASEIFAAHRVRLRARLESFAPRSCEILDRAGRNALAAHVPPASGLTILVLQRVRDLDLPGYDLAGVHWRYRGDDATLAGRRFILLTARARPPVLAHELGHYLGLPHDPAGGNLMTPGPSAPVWREEGPKPRPFAPVLTPRQARRLRSAVRRPLAEP